MHNELKSYIEENKERFLNELFALLKIPSVSADPAFKDDVIEAANFVADSLKEAGADKAEVCPTNGFPIVYAEKITNPSWPTVLVYGHYDVQPADPYELWDSPPFEPVIKDEKIYARGACDDKGQMFMHVKAFEFLNKSGHLKCNVKFMIEGEEEVGSPALVDFVKNEKERLKADVILISDTAMVSNDVPSITTGLRGVSYLEVNFKGPSRDLHSGVYGGAVVNPINALSKVIADLTDENNRITIPGFYDKVVECSPEEREAFAQIPFSEEAYKKDLGVDDVDGEKGYTTIERASIRPTLDVNGIWGGYIGKGAKTVLPAEASAKISMRLVPNQNSDEITALFQKHFEANAPKGIKVTVTPHHGGEPVVVPIDSDEYRAASRAYERTFQKTPLPSRGGGSIPIVAMFEEELGLKSLMMGFGLDTDAIHSPNEHYGLFNFFKGIETLSLFYDEYSKEK